VLILAQIQLQGASLEGVRSDSRGCQVLAPGEPALAPHPLRS
jgi:hypothetical protein